MGLRDPRHLSPPASAPGVFDEVAAGGRVAPFDASEDALGEEGEPAFRIIVEVLVAEPFRFGVCRVGLQAVVAAKLLGLSRPPCMETLEHECWIRQILRLASPVVYLFRGRVMSPIEAFLVFAGIEMWKNVPQKIVAVQSLCEVTIAKGFEIMGEPAAPADTQLLGQLLASIAAHHVSHDRALRFDRFAFAGELGEPRRCKKAAEMTATACEFVKAERVAGVIPGQDVFRWHELGNQLLVRTCPVIAMRHECCRPPFAIRHAECRIAQMEQGLVSLALLHARG